MNYWITERVFRVIGHIKVKLFGGYWSKSLNSYFDGEYERPDGTSTYRAGFISWTVKLPEAEELRKIRFGKPA